MHIILVRKPEGRSLLERNRHRWEDNIKMVLKEIGMRMWARVICLSRVE
jgi:hypothetical protein